MSEYTLEIKQIVDYPRCRIYRQFVQALIADRSIRVSGGSGLFYFVVLCAYANFRTSYKRIDGICSRLPVQRSNKVHHLFPRGASTIRPRRGRQH